jgi:hypothetical protein
MAAASTKTKSTDKKNKPPPKAEAKAKSASSSKKKKGGPVSSGPGSKGSKGSVSSSGANKFGKSMAAGKPKEPRDPKHLPGSTLQTDLGRMTMGWSATKGGSSATSKITGTKFAGKIGTKTIPAMLAEAAKLEGAGKATAKGQLETARTQATAADNAAGAWMRHEHDNLGSVQAAFNSLGSSIQAGATAIDDESRGDKIASVKAHEEMAAKVGTAMSQPISGDPKTYEEWQAALVKRSEEQEQANQGSLENVVTIAVDLPNSVAADVKGGNFQVSVTISPNTTQKTVTHSLAPSEFDPKAIIGEDGYNKSVERLKVIGAKLGWAAGDVEADAKNIWTTAIQTTRKSRSETAFDKLKPKDDPDGRADLDNPTMTLIMDDLEPIISAIEKYMAGMASQYKEGIWGFWSGKPADPVARENCGMTLEKSPLGILFDGNKIDGSWHIEMWATLSRAYAKWAAKDFEKKTFKGFVGRGSSADQSIFNKIEQPMFEMLTAKEKSKPKVEFYAVAGQKVQPGDPTNKWLKPDFGQTAGGCKGVFKTGDRNAMVEAAEAYNEKVENGIDASADSAGDTGKISDLPKHSYKNDLDEEHDLVISEEGGEVVIHRESLKPMPVRGRAFKTVALINDATAQYMSNKSPAALQVIRVLLVKLEKDMKFARGETDSKDRIKPVVAKRIKFEKKLGFEALRHKAAKGAVGGMADKAIKLMRMECAPIIDTAKKVDATLLKRDGVKDNPEFKKLVSKCGMKLDSGFGGAVGTDFDDVIKVFESGGDVSVKVQHVVQFGEILAEKIFETGAEELKAILSKIGVQGAAIKEIIDRKAATADDETPSKGKFGKTVYGDMKGNREMKFAKKTKKDVNGSPADYEMDTKYPSLPLEILDRRGLDLWARKLNNAAKDLKISGPIKWDSKVTDQALQAALTAKNKEIEKKKPSKHAVKDGQAPGAEGSPMVRSTRNENDADMGLTDGEKAGDGLGPGLAPFVEGVLANIVDEHHSFIKTARRLKMPLKAGISGTTHRFMNQASMMSAPLFGARSAILGHLIKINAHSFHEICTAAKGKVPYKRGEYLPFEPFTESEMFGIASMVVNTQEEKNILLNRKY